MILSNFFCKHKFHKLNIILFLKILKKKIWAKFQRIIEVFTQKIVTKLSKIWVWFWDRKKPIPDAGVKKAPDPGSGSATLKDRKKKIYIVPQNH
jgi:hypothetical protein